MFIPYPNIYGIIESEGETWIKYRIPCVLMRGGTSRGPIFIASDLPSDPRIRDKVLLKVMGTPGFNRVDGIAGMDPITSKLAIVSPSLRLDADIDYLFGQADLASNRIDYNANCGNILSAVAPFAVDAGLVKANPTGSGKTLVRIYNINTGIIVHATVETPNGSVEYEGATAIDGVPGSGAPIGLNFLNSVGSKTGKLLPTGRVIEQVQETSVSCVDVGVPMVIMAAKDLNVTGYETPDELNSNRSLMERLEKIRLEAAVRMGLGDCRGIVIPKVCLVSPSRLQGQLTSRYFTPLSCHPSHAVTGALGLAVASLLEGSVANQNASQRELRDRQRVVVEHPSGTIEVDLEMTRNGEEYNVQSAAFVRTASRLFEGHVLVTDRCGR